MSSMLKRAAVTPALIGILLALSACTQTATPTQATTPAQEESAAAEPSEDASSDSVVSIDRINLNDMTREQLLETIPDMGNRMVREFFEYQPYVSIQQFRREIGKYVDDDQVAFYESYVYVPVDVNESDAETLKQIPGLGDEIAGVLLAARPFDSNGAFLAALSEHVSEEQIDAAVSYLYE